MARWSLLPFAILVLAGCTVSGSSSGTRDAQLPSSPSPCAPRSASPSASQTPSFTKLAWRAEELRDGSVRMIVGDVRAAPRDPKARRTTSYKNPGSRTECEDVKIIKAKGWWCSTTVRPIALSGEIVVGGAEPRAQLHGEGFATECTGRKHRMRQAFRIQRDSWSGWRAYNKVWETDWTEAQNQNGPAVSAPCPTGRVGTYNYRLWVQLEIDGTTVGNSPAASGRIRTDCGTGVS